MSDDRLKNEIKKVDVNPNYLAQYVEQDDSLDALREHVTVPRFKILQATTDSELLKNFGTGSCIVRPGDTLVVKYNEEPMTFQFVPLFFIIEWAKWRDLKGTGPMIVERTTDENSEIARKSKDANTRRELYPGHENAEEGMRMYYNYVEHLRFIGVIYGNHPLAGTPVSLSFERGEWRQGKNFISAVSLRRQEVDGESVKVPLWAQVWNFKVVHHTPTQDKKWYGFNFEAAEPSIIPEEDAEAMRTLHLQFKELAAKQLITVQDEPDAPSQDDGSVKAEEDF